MFNQTSKKMSRVYAIFLTTLLLLSTLLINNPLVGLAAGAEASLIIGSGPIAPGETAAIAITARNIPSPGLVGFDISIQYNPLKLEVIGLEKKTASDPFPLQVYNITSPGIVKLVAAQIPGVEGDITLARLLIKAKALATGSTDLKLLSKELKLADTGTGYSDLTVQVINGQIEITSKPGIPLPRIPSMIFESTRVYGNTAEQTAVKIADKTGWTGKAILASSASYGMVDALTAGPLATFLKAPILLTEAGDVLNADTKAELVKLAVKKVYVTSGTSVISQAVLQELKGMNITVESLGGVDRFATSANIAQKMIDLGAPVTKVAVAFGWQNQDALSIASIASAQTQPILLTEKDVIPDNIKIFLTNNPSIKTTDVIGGTSVISKAVLDQLPGAIRHFGNTAYDTNLQVIKDFDLLLEYDLVYLANGETAIDALAGAPLAAQSKSAIILTDKVVPEAATFVNSKLTTGSVVTALGGIVVVSKAVLDEAASRYTP